MYLWVPVATRVVVLVRDVRGAPYRRGMRHAFVGSYGSADQIVEMAVEAERAGWDAFFTWDGITIGEVDTFDPWVLLGAIAVRTERIRLGAQVFSLARRRPWKVARESVTVDQLSHGRLIMPVGLGAVEDGGYSRVSGEVTSARERAERLDDCLDVLAKAWTGEKFSHDGPVYQATDVVFRPRPVQEPRIPVWAVGLWPAPRSMRRAARWDGVIVQPREEDPFAPATPEHVRRVVAWLGEHLPERDPAAPPFDVVVEGVSVDDRSAAVERVAALEEAGASWWVESRWDVERDTPEALLARIRQGPPR